jgi:Ca2+-binding EF-hand superfamily protein
MKFFKHTNSTKLLVLLVSGFLAISAQAEEIPQRGPIPFAVYDADGNELISEEEFFSLRGKRQVARSKEGRQMRGATSAPAFSKFDTDGDGQLTKDELAAGQTAQTGNRRAMGMGQDRGMSKGMGRNMPVYSDYDLNGDGEIIEQEFNEARAKRITERVKQNYQMRNLVNAPSFADIDTNGNGEVGAEEFAAHQLQHRQNRTQ